MACSQGQVDIIGLVLLYRKNELVYSDELEVSQTL